MQSGCKMHQDMTFSRRADPVLISKILKRRGMVIWHGICYQTAEPELPDQTVFTIHNPIQQRFF